MKCAVPPSLIAAMSLVYAGAAFAQGGLPSGSRMYDPKTVETISGTVMKVERTSGRRASGGIHGAAGIHLLLKTNKEEIAVRLGPAWYVDKQPVKVAAHDIIEVRGSRILYAGKPALVAAEVKKGDQLMKLRQDNGMPLWHVQSRRSG